MFKLVIQEFMEFSNMFMERYRVETSEEANPLGESTRSWLAVYQGLKSNIDGAWKDKKGATNIIALSARGMVV